MKRSLFIIILGVFLMTACKPPKTQMFLNFKKGEGQKIQKEVSVPFKLEKAHEITVDVLVNGTKIPMVLDTGGLTMVDASYLDSLSLTVTGEPHPGTKLAVVDELAIQDVKVNGLNTFFMEFQNKFNTNNYGMIGSDFLRFFQTEYNYQNQQITFRDPIKLKARNVDEHLLNMDIIFPYFPTVETILDGKHKIPGLIDTGLHYAFVLPVSWINNLSDEEKESLIEADGFFARWPTTKPPQNFLYRFNKLQIGDIVLKDVPVMFAEMPEFIGREVVLIGKYFMENYITILDYKNEQVMFREVEDNSYDAAFSAGIYVSRKDGKMQIFGVWKGSPADELGITPETELLAINGKTDWKRIEIMDILMNKTNIKFYITILREGKEEEILLRKRNLFE